MILFVVVASWWRPERGAPVETAGTNVDADAAVCGKIS